MAPQEVVLDERVAREVGEHREAEPELVVGRVAARARAARARAAPRGHDRCDVVEKKRHVRTGGERERILRGQLGHHGGEDADVCAAAHERVVELFEEHGA
jgi:hypothetical protein